MRARVLYGRRGSLQQPTPSGDVDIHLVCPGEILALLFEDFPLPLQFGFPRYHGVEELDLKDDVEQLKDSIMTERSNCYVHDKIVYLGKQEALGFQFEGHSVPDIVYEFF